MKFMMNRFVLTLLLCVAGMARAEDFAAQRAEVLALGRLTDAPAVIGPVEKNEEF